MLFHIHYCEECEMKCELSINADAFCGGCGMKMEKIGEMNE